jgi:hypothetical protein
MQNGQHTDRPHTKAKTGSTPGSTKGQNLMSNTLATKWREYFSRLWLQKTVLTTIRLCFALPQISHGLQRSTKVKCWNEHTPNRIVSRQTGKSIRSFETTWDGRGSAMVACIAEMHTTAAGPRKSWVTAQEFSRLVPTCNWKVSLLVVQAAL